MRSIWSVSLSLLSGLGLVGSLGESVWAGDRHRVPCFASVPVATATVPVLAVETRVVDAVIVVPSENQALLVLNCPADARVTIGGRPTHASGSTRQYRLRFDGDSHICPVEIRIRDNDEKATYRFETSFEFQPHQRVLLSIDRTQMEKISDTHPAEEMAKLLAPGTVLRVTDEQKLEAFVIPDPVGVNPLAIPPAPVQVLAPPKQVIEHQIKGLIQEQADVNRLAQDVNAKMKLWEAAVRIRQQLEDAHQLKTAEVNAANQDAAVHFAAGNGPKSTELKLVASAKQLEVRKLELQVARAKEKELAAKNVLTAAQHQLNLGQERVQKTQAELK